MSKCIGNVFARAIAPTLGLALGTLIAGCYTVLSHPSSEIAQEEEISGGCLRCHGTLDDYPDPYPYYADSYRPWINYYDAPWWYDTRWDRYDRDVVQPTPETKPVRPRVTAAWRPVAREDNEDLADEGPDFSPQLTAPRAPATAPVSTTSGVAPIASQPSEPKSVEPEKQTSRRSRTPIPVKAKNKPKTTPEQKQDPKSK